MDDKGVFRPLLTTSTHARMALDVGCAVSHGYPAKRPLTQAPPRLSSSAVAASGPVVSGIIGKTKFSFDIWGDTVNVASRMESTGVPGMTQVTADVYELLKDREPFGQHCLVDVKGKGKVPTYLTSPYVPQPKPALRGMHCPVHEFNIVQMLSSWLSEASSSCGLSLQSCAE